MSQVRNLRAMFEQKGDSSPPDRGRTQVLPVQAESPRPLSRVRTSFVTVEKDGRVGLQRDTSSDSIPTLSRTMSAGTDGDIPTPPASQTDILDVKDSKDTRDATEAKDIKEKSEESRPLFVTQTPKRIPSAIPEEAAPVTPTKVATPAAVLKPASVATPAAAQEALETTNIKVSAPTPALVNKTQDATQEDKSASSTVTKAEKSPARKLFAKPSKTDNQPTADAPKKGLDLLSNGATHLQSPRLADFPKSTNGATKATPDNATKSTLKASSSSSSIPLRPKVASAASTAKEAPKTKAATSTAKTALPKAISTTKSTTKPSAKSPSISAKTPTSPSKPLTPKLPAKAADRKAKAEKSTTAPVPKSTTVKASASQPGIKKPLAIQTFPPNGIGFVKPKPKSPTRPVQLPSSLTTHTASSATKTRQSLSRQSGSFLPSYHPVARSPSRTSVSTVGTATTSSATGHKTLRRQSSNVSRPRPSIGPPPKQAARDHPVTKKEKEVDEGFLKRMMRPTQASALKTADKTHQSPPRKQPTPSTAAAKKSIVRDSLGSVPKYRPTEAASVKTIPRTVVLEKAPAATVAGVVLVAPVVPELSGEAEPVPVAKPVQEESAIVEESAETAASDDVSGSQEQVELMGGEPVATAEDTAEKMSHEDTIEEVDAEEQVVEEVIEERAAEEDVEDDDVEEEAASSILTPAIVAIKEETEEDDGEEKEATAQSDSEDVPNVAADAVVGMNGTSDDLQKIISHAEIAKADETSAAFDKSPAAETEESVVDIPAVVTEY